MPWNWPHLHLALNHAPVIATPLGVALLGWGLLAKSRDLKRAGLVLLVLATLASIAAFWTGENSEEAVEGLAGVSHKLVHEHEEAAETARIAFLATGVLAALGLLLSRGERKVPAWLWAAILAAGMVTSGLLFHAAGLGGAIRHPEIGMGGAASPGGGEGGEQEDEG
ncbi:MAG TPA: hypothetical protein PK413_02495 [Thermoanaerobaculia bacterium]|nr:hypothetical protein [Thermoanaerobaculia bacterium]